MPGPRRICLQTGGPGRGLLPPARQHSRAAMPGACSAAHKLLCSLLGRKATASSQAMPPGAAEQTLKHL